MALIVLRKSDFRSKKDGYHLNMWESILDDLGLTEKNKESEIEEEDYVEVKKI